MLISNVRLQILRTRKDSMVGIGLASDFRFNTRAVGRQPRTAWGSEIETPIQFNAYTEANLLESFDFNGFPTIMPNTVRSLFGSKEKDRYVINVNLTVRFPL